MKPSLILAILVIGIILGAGGYLIAKNFSNLDKDIVQDNNKIPAVSPPPGKFQTVCGNQVCESGEDVKNCPSDCGGGITPPPGGKIPGPTPPPGGPTSPPVTPPPAGSPPPTAGFVNLPTLGSLNLTHGFFIRSFPQGNYLYLATGESARGFKVADISNPANPRIIAERSPGGMWSDDVFIEGNYAYLTTRVGSAGLVIYNISNPNNPTQVGKWSTSQEIHSIAVSGNYAYVVSYNGNTLEVIDISNPSIPLHKGTLTHGEGGASIDFPTSVFIKGGNAYATSSFGNALEIINISNPANPIHRSIVRNGDIDPNASLPGEDSNEDSSEESDENTENPNAPQITSYTFNGTAGNITASPLENPVSLIFTADKNVDWVSIKIENENDAEMYKIFFSGTGCVDFTSTCAKTWDGSLSSGGALQNGTYRIKIHIKDEAENAYFDYLSPHKITVTN